MRIKPLFSGLKLIGDDCHDLMAEREFVKMTAETRNQILSLDDRQLLEQADVDTYRASGPGGQKRNKTDSAVRLRHRPTQLMVIAAESRSQHENKAKALKRLRHAIALNLRATIDLENYRPGPILASCLADGDKLHVGRRDSRYNHVVAEILDLIDACAGRASQAASMLGVTTAQLTGFLRDDPKLWARVNQMRAAVGTKPLR